ncbi:DUF6087 family protein [Streptomyces sp. P9(2023)]|uniref:DUF6087 family protein n=1 Tax=Streptomyces sp. P9(2023) TaxID=3064394 RepID=UPI0028F40024|nr:DUF6087 family protein [Streptomyces sp. P9(2023)]MDT9693228.1 DUF6087 family protein [Streptomyces sp. P9(2023)]
MVGQPRERPARVVIEEAGVMAEEPLEEWAARRNRRQASDRQITGARRVVPLAAGSNAAHLAPDAPRLLLERGDTGGWVPVGVAENAAEAAAFLHQS